MGIDVEAVRRAYRELPDEGFAGVPSREERFAMSERALMRICEASGRCPKAEGLGEHGSLIGGKGKPMRVHWGSRPFDHCARPVLAPIAWFARLGNVRAGGGRDAGHLRLRAAIAAHMAGVPKASRPSGAALRAAFLSEAPSVLERAWLRLVLSSAGVRELMLIGSEEGFTARTFARAAHLSGTASHRLCNWLNQYAEHPQ